MPAYKINKTTGNPDTLIAGGTLYADAPLLTVVSSYDSVAAPGWARLTTDVAGRTLLRADYKELVDLVTKRGLIGAGKPFGEGNGSTTFVLPDAREATFKGIGLTSLSNSHYDADGVGLGEFVEDRTKAHAHNVYVRDTGHSHGTDSGNSLPSPNNLGITKNAGGVGWTANPVAGTASNTQSVSANIQVSSKVNFGDIDNATTTNGFNTNEVKSIGINYFMKVKQVPVPTDFLDAVDDIIKDTTVDAVTNGDMNPITSNAVYDEFKKVQPQTYECSGFILNSLAGEITGYGRATVILRDGIAEIKFSVRIHTNNMTSTFSWGLNSDLLHTLLPNLPIIYPVSTNSNLQFFAATGAVLVDLMGYGAMASGENQFWIPARMYQIDGDTGIWGSDQFPINSYITGTVYGTYTV